LSEYERKSEATIAIKTRIAAVATGELADLLLRDDRVFDAITTMTKQQSSILSPSNFRSPSGDPLVGFMTAPFASDHFNVRWVVREADLDILKELLVGITGAGGTYIFGGVPVPAAAVVGAIVGALLFFRKIKQKRAVLSPLQYQVLRGLKSSNAGMSLSQLEGWLLWANASVSRAELEYTLNQLKRFRAADGTIVTLADQDSSGQWSAAGL